MGWGSSIRSMVLVCMCVCDVCLYVLLSDVFRLWLYVSSPCLM